jgi:hypothetical protein
MEGSLYVGQTSRGAGHFSGARRLRMISPAAVIRSPLATVHRSCGAQTWAMPALSRHPPDDWLPNPSLQPADGIFKSGPSPGMPGCSSRRRDRSAAFSRRYRVQTPNKSFLVEPHLICLFLHWLPFRVKRRLIRYFTVRGLVSRPSQRDVNQALLGITLLNEQDRRGLFPDAEIIK